MRNKLIWHWVEFSYITTKKMSNIHSTTNSVECLSRACNLAIESKIRERGCRLKYCNV